MAHTVLVVDDSPNARGILAFMLQNKGYDVLQAGDGEEALAKIRGDLVPDIVVLDAMMPRKSGYEVCAEMKGDEELKKIPVLMLTAAAGEAEGTVRRWNKELQPDLVMAKPFKVQDVLARIEKFLKPLPVRGRRP